MRLESRQSNSIGRRFVTALRRHLPGAFLTPEKKELVALYRLRYRMAMDERKHDCARIFLEKIMEVDPTDLDARICYAELHHRHLRDFDRAVEQYNKVIRLAGPASSEAGRRARGGLTELIELLS
jgi:tetratricopeptide (TPR) repeat protein